jgi:two-component sensor histidine kinase
MVIHELATNSVKHGALSSETGVLSVSSETDDDDITLTWAETGGPAIASAPDMQGFGSRLITRSISGQFAGAIDYDWQPTGLVVTVRVRKALLAN